MFTKIKLNFTMAAIDGTLRMFTRFIDDLKRHNNSLEKIKSDAGNKISHYQGVRAEAMAQIGSNNTIISKVEGLLS